MKWPTVEIEVPGEAWDLMLLWWRDVFKENGEDKALAAVETLIEYFAVLDAEFDDGGAG